MSSEKDFQPSEADRDNRVNRRVSHDLSPLDKIKCAYLYHCWGIEQQAIAAFFCTNHGRINEAIKAVEKAVGLSVGGYKDKE